MIDGSAATIWRLHSLEQPTGACRKSDFSLKGRGCAPGFRVHTFICREICSESAITHTRYGDTVIQPSEAVCSNDGGENLPCRWESRGRQHGLLPNLDEVRWSCDQATDTQSHKAVGSHCEGFHERDLRCHDAAPSACQSNLSQGRIFQGSTSLQPHEESIRAKDNSVKKCCSRLV